MASAYGFRIYLIEAYPNRFKDNQPLRADESSKVRDRIVRLLESAHSMSTQQFLPRPSLHGEPQRPIATLTVGDPAVLRQDFLHVVVEAGTVGSHSHATKAGAVAQDLSDRSAEAAHNLAFLFSRDRDTRFLLIAETINGRDPVRRLMSLLTKIDIARRVRKLADDKAARKSAREAGLPIPSVRTRVRLAFDWKQAPDSQYLSDILGSAKSVSAVFKSLKPSSRGTGHYVDRSLTISLRDGTQNDAGRAVARSWEARQRSGGHVEKSDGVSELADVLGEQDLIYDGEAERYDEAALRVIAEDGARATIAVDTLREIFTYPVADGAPNDWYFFKRVNERLPIVAQEAHVRVRPIDPAEVRDWLAG